MKLTLLLFALLLSAYGWCSSGPAYHTARTVSSENHGVALIVCGGIFYIGGLLWGTYSAKRSLDRTLEVVMESMGQYQDQSCT